ncbi:hypothetical protein C8R44DRAFT_893061 [Mycena epipterygia]|nr:hypothetical protein C8R44DRAFT_893061 [Mycena epipterygia]
MRALSAVYAFFFGASDQAEIIPYDSDVPFDDAMGTEERMIDFCINTKLDDDTVARLWMGTDAGQEWAGYGHGIIYKSLGEPPRSEVLRFFHEARAGTLPDGYSTDWEHWAHLDDWLWDCPDWLIVGHTWCGILDQFAHHHGLVNTESHPLYHVMYDATRHDFVFRRGQDEYFIFCGGRLVFRYKKSYASLEEFLQDPFHVEFSRRSRDEPDDTRTVPPELEQIPYVGPELTLKELYAMKNEVYSPVYWKIRRTKKPRQPEESVCVVV